MPNADATPAEDAKTDEKFIDEFGDFHGIDEDNEEWSWTVFGLECLAALLILCCLCPGKYQPQLNLNSICPYSTQTHYPQTLGDVAFLLQEFLVVWSYMG